MKTSKEALATHLGMDYSDLNDCRYQYGRTPYPIYNIGETYYCCFKGSKKLWNSDTIIWVEVKDEYIDSFGFRIFFGK